MLGSLFVSSFASVACKNSLLVGDAPAHNIAEIVGVILAMSIVHGGPAPCFFTEAVADFILYGLEKTNKANH